MTRETDQAEILSLIEELTVSELCLAEELKNFGVVLSTLPEIRVELPASILEEAH